MIHPFFHILLFLTFQHLYSRIIQREDGIPQDRNGLQESWRPLDIRSAKKFGFTTDELCHSQLSSSLPDQICKYSKVNALDQCAVYRSGIGHVNGICPNLDAPFQQYQHNSSDNVAPLIHILYAMKSLNRTKLILIGDSLTRQHFADTFCQLRRFGSFSVFTDRQFLITTLPSSDYYQNHMRISSTLSAPIEVLNLELGTVDTWYVDFHQNTKQYLRKHLTVSSSVILINMGLHFNLPNNQSNNIRQSTSWQDYQQKYRGLFVFAYHHLVQRQRQLVFFRETSAQHFPTVDGSYYPSWDTAHQTSVSSTIYRCKPLQNKEAYISQNWRNELAKSVLHQVMTEQHPFSYSNQNYNHRTAGYNNHNTSDSLSHLSTSSIPVLSFYKSTATRSDLHISHSDCTHFCQTPLLWNPIWEQMYSYLKVND